MKDWLGEPTSHKSCLILSLDKIQTNFADFLIIQFLNKIIFNRGGNNTRHTRHGEWNVWLASVNLKSLASLASVNFTAKNIIFQKFFIKS